MPSRILINSKLNILATADEVWRVISDWTLIPQFWHGTRSLSRNDDGSFRIRFAFPAKGVLKIEKMPTKRLVKETYTRGPFSGTKDVSVTEGKDFCTISSTWDIKLKFPYTIFYKKMKDHMITGTKGALNRIRDYVMSMKD